MTSSAEGDRGRLPDFFIVGHPKSGTTALHEMLRSHPQIFMPELKEPRYFATDLRELFEGAERPGPGSPALPRTLAEYRALFRDAEPSQTVGEATPSYLRSTAAARQIALAQPAARIIAVLREPASFLRSLHLELVQNHVETERDLRRALAAEHTAPADRAPADRGTSPALPRYSDRVRYVEQLRRYEAVFPSEQILVLIYDDLRADNEGTVRGVLRFLGVDDTAPVAAVEANPTVHVRSLRLDRALHAVSAEDGRLARTAGATLKPLIPTSLRHGLRRAVRRRLLYGAPKPPDEELMLELRRRFLPEVLALQEHLARDLTRLWGYDRLT